MATSFGALGDEHRDLLVALLDTPPGPVPERELVSALRRHHDGSLSQAAAGPRRPAGRPLPAGVGMRVAWVHPTWRDLVIERLASDAALRRHFLGHCGPHGVVLALSTAGGAEGERPLPLIAGDEDWDALGDRIYALVPELEHAELGAGARRDRAALAGARPRAPMLAPARRRALARMALERTASTVGRRRTRRCPWTASTPGSALVQHWIRRCGRASWRRPGPSCSRRRSPIPTISPRCSGSPTG